ncbi:MAG: hypothetical protein AB1473_22335 [Thermodesulfobacteriota bacterium]
MCTHFEDVRALLFRAKTLETDGKFADASEHYKRAFRTGDMDEAQRLGAQCDLGHNLIMEGRHDEALANLAEAHSTSRANCDFLLETFRAFYLEIDALYRLHEIHSSDAEPGLLRLSSLIDEGLQWLNDVDKTAWSCALLFLKSRILWKLGRRDLAYELSEKALRQKEQFNCPGFADEDHATQVVKHARLLGYRNRAFDVLARYEHRVMSGIGRIRLLAQKVRLLLELSPPDVCAALDEARRLPLFAQEVYRAREQLIAFGELAVAAAAANSQNEWRAALQKTVDCALKDDTLDRKWLLRKSRSYVEEVSHIVDGKDMKRAKSSKRSLASLIERLDREVACRAAPK